MDILLIFLIAVITGIGLIVGIMLWVTNKAGHSAITSYFKAAEHIVEHHTPPPEWLKKSRDKEAIMKRMDDLILFFEHSTFFEDETARSTLLNKLNDERAEWEEKLTF